MTNLSHLTPIRDHLGRPLQDLRISVMDRCNFRCIYCMPEEKFHSGFNFLNSNERLSFDEIYRLTKLFCDLGIKKIRITGGEPLMYDLGDFTNQLHDAGLKTHIETSGAHPLSGDWDWICFSPKKFMAPLPEFYEESDELKVIVYNKSDFAWAESHAEKCHPKTRLFLQPEWSKKDDMMPLIVDYVKKNPKWRISLQTHKYLDIP